VTNTPRYQPVEDVTDATLTYVWRFLATGQPLLREVLIVLLDYGM